MYKGRKCQDEARQGSEQQVTRTQEQADGVKARGQNLAVKRGSAEVLNTTHTLLPQGQAAFAGTRGKVTEGRRGSKWQGRKFVWGWRDMRKI